MSNFPPQSDHPARQQTRISTREMVADIAASTGEILVLAFYIVAFPAAVSAALFIALTLGLGHIGIHLTLLSKGLMTAAAYLGLMVLMMFVEGRLATSERVSRALERMILGHDMIDRSARLRHRG